jgi:hypothetical protein
VDPNPIKHPAVLLAQVRAAIEPTLLAARFRFEGRNDPRHDHGPPHLWIDYSRGEEVASLRWDAWRAALSLVAIDANGTVHEIATVGFDGVRSTSELEARTDRFIRSAQSSAYFLTSAHAEQSREGEDEKRGRESDEAKQGRTGGGS